MLLWYLRQINGEGDERRRYRLLKGKNICLKCLIPLGIGVTDRLWEVDCARGFSLGLMLVFNWSYALSYLDIYTIVDRGGWFYWTVFPRFIASLFIFIVGVSLTLSVNRLRENRPEQWRSIANRKYPTRGLRIFALGRGITVVTFWYNPERVIYFGILHLIGIAIVLSRPLLMKMDGLGGRSTDYCYRNDNPAVRDTIPSTCQYRIQCTISHFRLFPSLPLGWCGIFRNLDWPLLVPRWTTSVRSRTYT